MSRDHAFTYRDRKVRERRREEERDKPPLEPKPLSDFADARVVVLLGEPGLGKTRAFKHAAHAAAAEYRTVSRFLAASSVEPFRGKTLYLDALDEYRAKSSNGKLAVDELLGKLEALSWPKLRLSCRTIDWQDGDTKKLQQAARGSAVVVADLLPLSDDDILALVRERLDDPQAFIDGTQERGLEALLGNPELLDLLLTAYAPERRWPDNRRDMFERALAELIKETNEEDEACVEISLADLTAAADRLMAIALLANRDGFAMRNRQADDLFAAIERVDGEAAVLRQAAGRRVFSQSSPGRVEPRHRTVAEYMTARHLRDQICARENPLPLSRALALLTGPDGGTVPDTRSVFAWLAALLTGDDAKCLIARDPLGAILYGDAASWSPNTKVAAFAALRALADRDPWFRDYEGRRWDRYDGALFGGLACPELVAAFRDVLLNDSRHHMVSTALDIIEHGPPLPELGNDLLALARNGERDIGLRVQAVDAFARVAPDRTDALVEVLNEVKDGRVTDEEYWLHTRLLRHLYPAAIGPAAVTGYLVDFNAGSSAEHMIFLIYDLLPKTRTEDLAILADALAERKLAADHYSTDSLSKFVGGLLNRIVTEVPESVTADRLWRWLGIGLNDEKRLAIKRADAPALFDLLDRGDVFLRPVRPVARSPRQHGRRTVIRLLPTRRRSPLAAGVWRASRRVHGTTA